MPKPDPSEVSVTVRPDGLQLDEHRGWQRGMWRVQRASWLGLALFLGLALAGWTGRGGVAHHREAALGAGRIEFPRVTRWGAADDVTVTFAGPGTEHVLHLGTGFVDAFEIEAVVPAPRATRAVADGQEMVFATAEGGGVVRLQIRPSSFGVVRFGAALDGAGAAFSTLVLP